MKMTKEEKVLKLKEYSARDKVVYAEDKRIEVEEQRRNIPKFLAFSGIKGIDDTVEGFRKGQLVVVSGPPKNGKTALCQMMTKKMAEQNQKCLWFSYELTYGELFDKFPKFDKGILDFYVPQQMESGNLNWVEDRIIEAKHKYGLDVVFIDHLDFLRDTEIMKINQNMASYVGAIVQKIKRIAVEQELVIFLMSHLRKNKWTSNSLPSSEELRDTGQTAQLADIVMMIIRKRLDGVYDENKALAGIMENRHNGKTKKIHLLMQNGDFVEELLSAKEEKEFEQQGFGDFN